jgi:hypothetical protein
MKPAEIKIRGLGLPKPSSVLRLNPLNILSYPPGNLNISGSAAKVSILGSVTTFVHELSKYTVLDLDTENSSLEDIFMQYYGDSSKNQTAVR